MESTQAKSLKPQNPVKVLSELTGLSRSHLKHAGLSKKLISPIISTFEDLVKLTRDEILARAPGPSSHLIARLPATSPANDSEIHVCQSGAMFFGFGHPLVVRVLESMPGVAASQIVPSESQWARYHFRYQMPSFEEITFARRFRESLRGVGTASAGGCARATPWGDGKDSKKAGAR